MLKAYALTLNCWLKISVNFIPISHRICCNKIHACTMSDIKGLNTDTSSADTSSDVISFPKISSETEVNLLETAKDVKPEDLCKTMSKRAFKKMKRYKAKLAAKNLDCVKNETNRDTDKKKEAIKMQKVTDLIHEAALGETDYYFENGLRKVRPYHYNFTSFAKGRWLGHKLLYIFSKEFQNYSEEKCRKHIVERNILVNDRPVDVDYVICNSDLISNRVHRHELPVTADPVEILVDDEEVLVINKPSSIPIHPCGRYRHNTLLFILAKEHGFRNLRLIYRLDRLTSGVLIFCKTEAKTKSMMDLIRNRQMKKEYVCRVEGQFPSGIVECTEPIHPLSQKLGIYKTSPEGKESKTLFEIMSYNGKTSVVKCYPIINDPLYNGSVWGPDRGKGGQYGCSDEEVIAALMKSHNSSMYLDMEENDTSNCHVDVMTATVETGSNEPVMSRAAPDDMSESHRDGDIPQPLQHRDGGLHSLEEDDDQSPPEKRFKPNDAEEDIVTVPLQNVETAQSNNSAIESGRYDPNCSECNRRYVDPRPDQLVMYLHAFKYEGPDWVYSTPLPHWATEDFKS